MHKHNIALIGFRATGKSVVGRLLARELGWTFRDMDSQLVASFGQDINTWVQAHGWESFRGEESRLLDTLAHGERQVVSTGGGIVLAPANRLILRESFWVFWLQASPETIHTRMTEDPHTTENRPSLTGLPPREEIEHILSERFALYQETADFSLSTDADPPAAVASRIRDYFKAGPPCIS